MAKVRVPNSKFTGISHGLKFSDGVSEDIKDKELQGRLIRKGYELVNENKRNKQKEGIQSKEQALGGGGGK